jgi:pyruvate dehydrogenase E2 component (dihydrolipoamide acetyltransferase)
MSTRDFLLPDLGEGLEDAEIVAWRVAEGDTVELNQILVEVNTAKALVEIPSPWPGVIERLHAAAGAVLEVGKPLVSIRVDDTDTEEKPKRQAVLVGYGVDHEENSPGARARLRRDDTQTARRGQPVAASPPVRRLAKELGVELASISGTGPGGRVTREDVQRAAGGDGVTSTETQATEPRDGETTRIPVRGTRRLIAEKMSRSVREIPHVTTFLTLDATWLEAFRAELAAATGQRIGALAVVVSALAAVCAEHPKLNGSFEATSDGAQIVLHGRVNVGVATDTENGLLVPVVRDAGGRGIVSIAEEIARLSEAARSGRATAEDLSGGTVTVSNVGSFGAEAGTPIINHPEGAILALGVIEPRALVVDGEVLARPAATLSLSFDHRLMDGAEAGRALRALGDLLQSPFGLGALPR